MINVAVITVSDRCSAGEQPDLSGPLIVDAAIDAGMTATLRVVSDDRTSIVDAMNDASRADVIVTNGGTGAGPRDVTPEATRNVISYELPGIAEAMRASGRAHTPLAALSRQVCGVTAARTVVINLPGSPSGASEGIQVVLPLLEHLVTMIRGAKH